MEQENVLLLTQLKSMLVQVNQKGYTRGIIERIRLAIDQFKSIEDCYLLLILDELQAALKSLFSLYKLVRV